MKITIELKGSEVLINGKPYNESTPEEQDFFKQMLIAVKIIIK